MQRCHKIDDRNSMHDNGAATRKAAAPLDRAA
jgi:hypothetical protein